MSPAWEGDRLLASLATICKPRPTDAVPGWFEKVPRDPPSAVFGVAKVIRALRTFAMPPRAGDGPRPRPLAFFRKHRCIACATRHRAEQGIAIGSGAREAANKTLVKLRKASGSCARRIVGKTALPDAFRARVTQIRPLRAAQLEGPDLRIRHTRQRQHQPRAAARQSGAA